jgi:hypothetical protein
LTHFVPPGWAADLLPGRGPRPDLKFRRPAALRLRDCSVRQKSAGSSGIQWILTIQWIASPNGLFDPLLLQWISN